MKKEIKIDIAGDITPSEGSYAKGRFDRYLKSLAKVCNIDSSEALEYPFYKLKALFSESLTIANFESTVLPDEVLSDNKRYEELKKEKSEYEEGKFKNFHLAAGSYGAKCIYPQYSNINVLNLANNHSWDFGELGLDHTIKFLKEGNLTYFGAGKDRLEAYLPKYINYKGVRIALIGVSMLTGDKEPDSYFGLKDRVAVFDHDKIEKHKKFLELSIGQAKANNSQIIITYYHWGREYDGKIEDYQKEVAHMAAELGADIVAGCHQHIVQAIEDYKTKDGRNVPIAYGLGNLMFGAKIRTKNSQGMILRVKYSLENSKPVFNGYRIISICYNKGYSFLDRILKKLGFKIEFKEGLSKEECFSRGRLFSPRIIN